MSSSPLTGLPPAAPRPRVRTVAPRTSARSCVGSSCTVPTLPAWRKTFPDPFFENSCEHHAFLMNNNEKSSIIMEFACKITDLYGDLLACASGRLSSWVGGAPGVRGALMARGCVRQPAVPIGSGARRALQRDAERLRVPQLHQPHLSHGLLSRRKLLRQLRRL